MKTKPPVATITTRFNPNKRDANQSFKVQVSLEEYKVMEFGQ